MEVVQRDERIDQSLSTLSSLAHRLPASLHLRLTAQLSVQWARWQRLPLNVRGALVCASLLYFALFSLHTHVVLLLFYSLLLFTALSVRDEVTSVADQRGLLSLVPASVLPYASEYSLLELTRLLLSSTVTSDVLLLLCFQLSEPERRAVMQRLPAPYGDWLMRRGLVNLLPDSVQQLLYPAPQRRCIARVIALADDDACEEQLQAQVEPSAERLQERLGADVHELAASGEWRAMPSDMMERKYDDEGAARLVDDQLYAWPPVFRPPSLALTPASLFSASNASFPRQSSLSSTLPPPSPAASDDSLDPASVTLSSVLDRQLSSSFSALFRSWARQSYTALYDATAELLPGALTGSSSLHFFAPLAASIVGLHVVSSDGRVRQVIRSSRPYVVDGAVCASALLAAHHLYVLLVEGYSRRREERRLVRERSGEAGAVSAADAAGGSGRGWAVRVWLLFVYRKCRSERGVFVSGLVLLCWLLYVTRARSRVWRWLEQRELHRRGALAQLANRLA